ncbi:MFS transporter [Phyllobacterium bourgognense]|uniref:Putative MFS family arabinose efflux permease n=1 Tax=Phyllobacterium bourgognense TaxID=314236 RepID=A0A368Z634_9HYPH|nr:MFS transporter [Phyllobacterium bourgognense]RCW87910.1 putative MFS family arabinose efflux permease [Phyllobacterium bourgognense]
MRLTNELEDRPIWRDPRAIALMMAASLTVMTAATISPALPGLERQFAGNETNALLIRLLVPAPSLAVVLVAPWCGAIADRSGRRRMLLAGLILFIISGSAGLVLPTLPLIMVSRVCLGVALAMIMTAQSALIGDYFSGRTLHAISSGQVSARNFGGFVFILVAGLLATVESRLPFAVYVLPALALPFFWRVIVDLPSSMPAEQSSTTSSSGRFRPVVYLLAFGQMVITTLFFVMPTQLPFFLSGQGYSSPAVTGTALGTLMLAGGCAALCYPHLREAIGHAGNWACGFGLMATGFATLVTIEAGTAVFIGCAAIGAGYALATPGFIAISLGLTPPSRRGKTGALLTASVFLGQFLSPLVSSPAISEWGWRVSGIGLAAVLGTLALISGLAFRHLVREV